VTEIPFEPPSAPSRLRIAARRSLDGAITARHALIGNYRRLDRLAASTPRRDVIVISPYRQSSRVSEAVEELSRSRHRVAFVLGSRGPESDPAVREQTVATNLDGLLMQNRNELLAIARRRVPDPRWTIAIDDDVRFTRRWLNRFIALCEAFDLVIAGPALTWRSHRAWRVTARSPRSLVRETRFVEIGPVVAFREEAARELLPFPADAGMGWGLDFQWPVVAYERGWKMGIVDAAPIRHEDAAPGSSYAGERAHDGLLTWLETHPHITPEEAERTSKSHARLPRGRAAA